MAQNGRRHIFWEITVSNRKKYMDLEREEQKKSAKILYCTLSDLDSRPCQHYFISMDQEDVSLDGLLAEFVANQKGTNLLRDNLNYKYRLTNERWTTLWSTTNA